MQVPGVAGASPAAEFTGVTWAGGSLHSPAHREASLSSWAVWAMQLMQAMRQPSLPLQASALTSVLPRGRNPSPGWSPWLSGRCSRAWIDVSAKGRALETPFSSILLTSPTHTLPSLSFTEIIFCFLSLDISPFFFQPFKALRLCSKRVGKSQGT